MARPMKYKTPAALGRAVDKYFDSICRMVEVTEWVETGKITTSGKPLTELRTVYNALGEVMRRVDWLEPPSISGLCLRLGLSREGFAEYGRRDGFADVVAWARARVECYLEQTLIEKPKAARGATFNLSYNFGWHDRREVDFGADTRKALAAGTMSMDEKAALLREAATDLGQMGDHGRSGAE